MAKHEFGIMMDAPQQGKRYDEYEPWKYACISVDDAYLEGVVERLTSIDFYWHRGGEAVPHERIQLQHTCLDPLLQAGTFT